MGMFDPPENVFSIDAKGQKIFYMNSFRPGYIVASATEEQRIREGLRRLNVQVVSYLCIGSAFFSYLLLDEFVSSHLSAWVPFAISVVWIVVGVASLKYRLVRLVNGLAVSDSRITFKQAMLGQGASLEVDPRLAIAVSIISVATGLWSLADSVRGFDLVFAWVLVLLGSICLAIVMLRNRGRK